MKKVFSIFRRIYRSRIVRWGVLAIFLGGLTGGGITAYQLYTIAQTLPPVEEITKYRLNQPSMVYDVNGQVIAELGVERRYPVGIDNMSIYVRQAVVAVEDARFYEHKGVDMWGIMRAVVKNARSGRFAEGGSTLTQQLVKNIFFSPEKKLIRKYKEAVLAYRLDNYLSKDEILEFYLNFVNFGRGGYGVQAASINYFGKDAKDLTLAESALLAGIPKAPSTYSPHINADRAKQRRNHVLLRMYENGYINEDQYITACEAPIEIIENPPLRLRHAGYFLDYVLRYLSEELDIPEPQNMGLKVYTTLDIEFQEKAEAAIQNHLRDTSKRLGYFGPAGKVSDLESQALLSVDGEELDVDVTIEDLLHVPSYLSGVGYKKALVTKLDQQLLTIQVDGKTGYIDLKDNRWAKAFKGRESQLNDFKTILAVNDIIYVVPKEGTEDRYLLEQDPPMEAALFAINPQTGAIMSMVGGFSFEKSMFNRATQAKRPVGSVFKPIVYSTALERGVQPMDKILDAPLIMGPDERGEVWRPKNFEDMYYGETTIKEGVTRSRNIVTIKLAEQVGLRNVLQYTKKFGITSDIPADLSITIGSGSISLQEMVYAYSVFPNMGSRPVTPYFVTKVEDSDGNVLYDIPLPEFVEVIHPNTAQIMTDILINVVEDGTGRRAKVIPRPIGAKTGTTNESRDIWFMGFLPNFVAGVWVGFDDYSTQANLTASASAAPAWVEYVSSVVDMIPPAVFPVAQGVEYKKVNVLTWELTDDLITENVSFEPYKLEALPQPEEEPEAVALQGTVE